MNTLNPAYIRSLTARNRLTDARGAVHDLLTVLPELRSPLAQIYNDLCAIQGRLETLLDDVPTCKSYATCRIMRIKIVRHGRLNSAGETVITHGETVTEPCNTPLFEETDRRLGVCRSCRRGWETGANKFASEQERAKACPAATDTAEGARP